MTSCGLAASYRSISQVNTMEFIRRPSQDRDSMESEFGQIRLGRAVVEDSVGQKEIFEKDHVTLLKLGLDDGKQTAVIRIIRRLLTGSKHL